MANCKRCGDLFIPRSRCVDSQSEFCVSDEPPKPDNSLTRFNVMADRVRDAELSKALARVKELETFYDTHVGDTLEADDLRAEITRLKRVLARELSENDELGAEYTYVIALKEEVARMREALESLVDPNPCATDHNLFCQEHGSSHPCVNRVAAEALASLPETGSSSSSHDAGS